MTVQMITNAHRQVAADILTPDAQTSTNAETVLSGSELDARMWDALAYTAKNGDGANTIQWSVYGANASDYADEVVVQALADVAPGAVGSYTVSPPPFAYYRAKIHSKVDGAHGAVTLRAIAKG